MSRGHKFQGHHPSQGEGLGLLQIRYYVPRILEGGTKFTIVYDMKVGGLLKLFSPTMVSSMRKELKKSLGNFKGILEAQI